MSEQAEPATEQDIEATPETGATDEEVLYKQRYESIRPEYDRTQNELHRYQKDPEFRKQLFEELMEEQGYTLPDADDVYQDPTEQLRAEMREEIQRGFSERDQAMQHQEAAAYAEHYAEGKLDDLKVDDETIRDWIVTKATAMPALKDDQGFVVPDVEAAYLEYQNLINAEKKRWSNTKTGGVVGSEGQANTGVPAWKNETDPDKRREMRIEWAMEQVALKQEAENS